MSLLAEELLRDRPRGLLLPRALATPRLITDRDRPLRVPPETFEVVGPGDTITITALPATVNLVLYQGDTFWLRLAVIDEDGQPWNLDGVEVVAQVRATPEAEELEGSFDPLVAGNEVYLELRSAVSQYLPRNGVWDCRMASEGNVTTLCAGTLITAASVSRPMPGVVLEIRSTELPNAVVGVPYSATLLAAGGAGRNEWSVASLPDGLMLTGDTIQGIPSSTAVGPTSVSVTVEDRLGETATATLSINVAASLPQAPTNVIAVAAPGQVTLSWSPPDDGGSPILGYTVVGTPAGSANLAAVTSTTITGLTNGVGHSFTIAARNAVGTGPPASSGVVFPHTQLGITSSTNVNGTVGVPLSTFQIPGATGGVPPYVWSIAGDPLPAGLEINSSNGQILGTPTTPASLTRTRQVTDLIGNTAVQDFTITIT